MLTTESKPEEYLAEALTRLNEALGAPTGSPFAAARIAEVRAIHDVAELAIMSAYARVPRILLGDNDYVGTEYADGYAAGADSEVDLVVELDGTTEAGITPEEAAVRQADEILEAGNDPEIYDGLDDDFGRVEQDVFGSALAEAKAIDKKKSKKEKSA